MRLAHPPPSTTRFWAKPLAGWCECPRCGKVLYFQSTPRGVRRATAYWDKTTARLQCPKDSDGCGLVMLIGLIAWPVDQGGGLRTIPRDHVPDERQLAQLRSMAALGAGGAGWWMPKDQAKPAKRPDDTNITAKCTCPPQSTCPIHRQAYDAAIRSPRERRAEAWRAARRLAGSCTCAPGKEDTTGANPLCPVHGED